MCRKGMYGEQYVVACNGCPKMDAEPWRMDVKEQQVLFAAAEEYWLGMRWGEWGVLLNILKIHWKGLGF